MPTLGERIGSLYQKVTNFNRSDSRIKTPEENNEFSRAGSYQQYLPYSIAGHGDKIYKAVIPQWFYKPPWGLPLQKDVVEIRRLAATPYVTIIRNTIANEISGLDWDLRVEDGANVPPEVLNEVKKFLYNPNSNDESIGFVIKQLVGDSVELDGAVLEKVHNLRGELVEVYARDAGLFTKNPDIHGVMPEYNAYWQYSWTVGTPPIPFNHVDLIYMIRNPRTDTVYGRGEVETLYSVLRMLLYGIENNLEYYTEMQTASGVLKLAGAKPDEIERFKVQWAESMRKADTGGFWRRALHKVPIVNNDVEFIKTGFSPEEYQFIEQQQWFSKLVWACFSMSPSEVGFTDDVNRASAVMESASVKRKLLKPFMMMIEYYFDTQLINDLPMVKGKYEDLIHFEFDRTDLGYEKVQREIVWGDYERGLITKNQALEEIGYPVVVDGDSYKNESVVPSFGQNTLGNFDFSKEQAQEKQGMGGEESFQKNPEEKAYLATTIDVKALDTSSAELIKEFEEYAGTVKQLDASFDAILKNMLREANLVEKKALPEIGGLLAGILGLVDFSGVGKQFQDAIRDGYNKGLELAGLKTKQNFVPNANTLKFLQSYAFDNVKGLEGEFRKDLRHMVLDSYSKNESPEKLRETIAGVFDMTKNRAKMIAVTELNRAMNAGKLQGYKESGVKGKVVWKAQADVKAGHPCYELNGKSIEAGKLFRAKGFVGNGPPAHPNCVCKLDFVAGD